MIFAYRVKRGPARVCNRRFPVVKKHDARQRSGCVYSALARRIPRKALVIFSDSLARVTTITLLTGEKPRIGGKVTSLRLFAAAFIDLQAGLKLALWPRRSIAHDTAIPLGIAAPTEFTLGHNVRSRAEVDTVMEQAKIAGALIVKTAQETFRGGGLRRLLSRPRWPPVGGGVEPAVVTRGLDAKKSDEPFCQAANPDQATVA